MNDEELYDEIDDEILNIDDGYDEQEKVYEEGKYLDKDRDSSAYNTSSSPSRDKNNLTNSNYENQPKSDYKKLNNQTNSLNKENLNSKKETLPTKNRDFDRHKANNLNSEKKDSDKIKHALNKNKNQNLFRNRNENDNNDNNDNNSLKGQKKQIKNEALQQGASAAIQSAGVPKPIADDVISQITVDRIKKQLVKQIVIAVLPILCIILIPIIIVAGNNDASYVSSGMASKYLYGSGDDTALYNYLESIHHCAGEEECKNSDGAKFYKRLKEKLSNSNLTKGEADAVIVTFIGYNRGSDDMFKAIDEIDFIANILTKNGPFLIKNIESYRDDFIKIDDENSSYFSKYRSDIAANKTLKERQDIFEKIVGNAKNVSSINDYQTPIIGGTCSYNVDGMNPSNIKVKLLECGSSTSTYIDDEELIDFETYITGVVYAENDSSSYEVLKAQAIAARSYALTRGSMMDESSGIGLTVENGEWILSIRNCTSDQVYCDPDKGCWSNSPTAEETVHSVFEDGKSYSKGVLSQDSDIRKAVEETKGEVMVDSTGKVLYTPFTSTEQNKWNELSKEGKDHFEILKATYSNMNKIEKSCNKMATGEYADWKQCNMPWSNIKLGASSGDMCRIGCLVTSIAIEIAKSGTPLTVDSFDPGVLVNYLNNNNGFTTGGGLSAFTKLSNTSIAPNFEYVGIVSLTGTKKNKAQTIQSYVDNGYYIVIKAKSDQHWVALNYVDGENIYIFDPSTKITNIWDSAEYDVPLMVYFKA